MGLLSYIVQTFIIRGKRKFLFIIKLYLQYNKVYVKL